MPQTPLSNTGINYEHTLGADDWKNSYDTNWVIADLMAQAFVLGQIVAEPATPQVGDAYILGSATKTGTNWGSDTGAVTNSIALYTNVPGQTDSSPWYYMVPREGWTFYDRTNNRHWFFDGTNWIGRDLVVFQIALSDLTTAIAAANDVAYFRSPFAWNFTGVRASLFGACASGTFTIDINENTATLLTTKLTIDATDKTSVGATTPPVIGGAGPAIADDAEITFDIDDNGDGTALGCIVTMYGYRT